MTETCPSCQPSVPGRFDICNDANAHRDFVNKNHWLIDGDPHAPAFETSSAANRWSISTKGYREPIQPCHCGDFHSHRDDA